MKKEVEDDKYKIKDVEFEFDFKRLVNFM